ncbi:hypothetical protein [Microvirga subterranea]|uniref:Quinol:cytochrome c oxidoreductase quinone-binding subunit 2 n=1 Tax=Microvirga subterranea TaxID=186651 RepID=A0A370HRF1_9HYPH|nr:hypothetical protein [Microvirga subterranea]RDI61122.1 hypothetical protein DES45_102517 [Microvirga subterranea]
MALALAVAAAFASRTGVTRLEATYMAFVMLAGFSMGGLALLMIGHLMNEHWLAPVRSEAEAAALMMPLLLVIGIPLAFGLDQLFPWARGEPDLPPARAAFLDPRFYLARSVAYIGLGTFVACWLVSTRNPRRVSGIGLAVLTPVMTFAAFDWVLSRSPQWWSSLFGFAFSLSQVLAALAAAILITLLKPEHAAPKRMLSLERALLTALLLALWTWFAQFLIVWLANLPAEVSWYLDRSDPLSLGLIAVAVVATLVAVAVLVPSGVSRATMIIGSALALVQHAAHMLFIFRPVSWSWLDLGLAGGAVVAWACLFTVVMRTRPTYEDEMAEDP